MTRVITGEPSSRCWLAMHSFRVMYCTATPKRKEPFLETEREEQEEAEISGWCSGPPIVLVVDSLVVRDGQRSDTYLYLLLVRAGCRGPLRGHGRHRIHHPGQASRGEEQRSRRGLGAPCDR